MTKEVPQIILNILKIHKIKKEKEKALWRIIKAFISRMLKNIVFNNSKYYFINFNTLLYNIPTIKGFILFNTSLKYFFLIIL